LKREKPQVYFLNLPITLGPSVFGELVTSSYEI
jgi:hypothetical protein